MLRSRSFWMLAAAVALLAAPFFLPGGTSEFKGADDRGAEAIAAAGHEPWFKPIWQPPSNEVATGLFALQAALGGGLLGYVIGRRSARKNVADR
jgi:cobalt/nickel transport protein